MLGLELVLGIAGVRAKVRTGVGIRVRTRSRIRIEFRVSVRIRVRVRFGSFTSEHRGAQRVKPPHPLRACSQGPLNSRSLPQFGLQH